MSSLVLELLAVFLIFDGSSANMVDQSFLTYECNAFLIKRIGAALDDPVPCSVTYDARADRPSEYFTESPMPRPGESLMGCIFAVDEAGNRSDCVAPSYLLGGSDCDSSTDEVQGLCDDFVDSEPGGESTSGPQTWP